MLSSQRQAEAVWSNGYRVPISVNYTLFVDPASWASYTGRDVRNLTVVFQSYGSCNFNGQLPFLDYSSYVTTSYLYALPCDTSACPSGYYTVSPCTLAHDRVCAPCPLGCATCTSANDAACDTHSAAATLTASRFPTGLPPGVAMSQYPCGVATYVQVCVCVGVCVGGHWRVGPP